MNYTIKIVASMVWVCKKYIYFWNYHQIHLRLRFTQQMYIRK